jgi:hypothetical protein
MSVKRTSRFPPRPYEKDKLWHENYRTIVPHHKRAWLDPIKNLGGSR